MTSIGAAFSTHADTGEAVRQACAEVREQLAGAAPDLAYVFLTPEHLGDPAAAVDAVRTSISPRHVVGCVSQGVLAGSRELERGPAAAVWAASLPDATITPFSVEGGSAYRPETAEDAGGAGIALPHLGDPMLVTILVDPFGFPADAMLRAYDAAYAGVPLVGGIATGGGRSGTQALILDDEIHRDGAVGVAIAGVSVATVVSQGCAPVGREAIVTSAEANVIHELAGEPALERLQSEFRGFSERERQLASEGLLAGLVIDENKPAYGRGDFLMRGIIGADRESGSLSVGEQVRTGQTVRFHVRDASSAREDLERAFDDAIAGADARPAGALLFTCNGRGSHMFAEGDHDAAAVTQRLAQAPIAGCFCGGEIGPIGGRTFVHGFTATLAVFLEAEASAGKPGDAREAIEPGSRARQA